jgi:hypothetical protein
MKLDAIGALDAARGGGAGAGGSGTGAGGRHVSCFTVHDCERVAALLADAGLPANSWGMDSCATTHICVDERMFKKGTLVKAPGPHVLTGNGRQRASGVGTIVLRTAEGNTLELTEVLYMPAFPAHLISVPRLVQAGMTATFRPGAIELSDSVGLLARAAWESGLPWLHATVVRCEEEETAA